MLCLMSQMGQKRKCRRFQVMSALPHKADINSRDRDVRFVPEGDSAPPQMTIKEAANGGPLAQPAAFRVVTSARRPRSRPRGSWRICCQRLPQSASV